MTFLLAWRRLVPGGPAVAAEMQSPAASAIAHIRFERMGVDLFDANAARCRLQHLRFVGGAIKGSLRWLVILRAVAG